MENKTTTELLDLLQTLVDKDGNLDDKWQDAYDELITRSPFIDILSTDMDDSLPLLKEQIDDLKEEIKQLKRHKHDPKTNDVMIRI